MRTAYITHPQCRLHEMSEGHPESASRIRAIEDQLIASGILHLLQHHDAPKATREQLERVHAPDYLDWLDRISPEKGLRHIDPDTYMNPHTLDAALRSAGAAVLAVDLVVRGTAQNVFCNVRPPGHHAERDCAMGFCFFNNVAVGAAHALTAHGLDRVAVTDFDVHYGNGTVDIFRDDPRVLICSTYQEGIYPFMDVPAEEAYHVNVKLAAGDFASGFRDGINKRWLPRLEAFRPQMIMVSAGFDAHYEDDLSDANLVERDYRWVTDQLLEIAARFANGRLVSVLEGGYSLHALGRSVVAHVRSLMGL